MNKWAPRRKRTHAEKRAAEIRKLEDNAAILRRHIARYEAASPVFDKELRDSRFELTLTENQLKRFSSRVGVLS